ncbi:MAG: universal stress protein [Gloeobacteraceae cyanobacterium ES-bin-316]|nr:universal stress protein [Ferruginibacter sp.]
MKKILLILNESHIPHQVIQRAIQIAKKSNSLLEAVFINDVDGFSYGYPFPNDLYLSGGDVTAETRTAVSMRLLGNIAQEFKNDCNDQGVEYKIEISKSVSLKRLINLSSFADLMIADSLSDSAEYSLKDLLADAHCPLLLISQNAEPIEKIFVAYDGSPSSMYAMKMFSYIFPEHINLHVHFFQIAYRDDVEIRHLNEIKSWASMHFSNIKFELIKGNTKEELVKHIMLHSERNIVIMGAYSASSITRLFFKSTAESVIKETNASLFITHQ